MTLARSPIEIGISSDTGAFRKGVASGIIEPLEDAQKALDDLAESRGPDGLERDMRDAQRQTEKLKDETDRTADAIEKDFKRAYRETKQAADDGLGGVSRKSEEVSGELRQNLGETFSSFRGDLEDLPQIAQDVFGGLAGSVGGLVPAFGLAAGAAGVGLLISAFQAAEERRQQLADRANDLANAYIEAGTNVMDAMSIAARTSEIITGDERKEAEQYAKVLGVDLPTAARAMAGDTNALATVNAIAAQATRDANAAADEQRESLKALTPEQQSKVQADLEAINAARELGQVVSDANQKFNDQQGVLKGIIADADGAAVSVDNLGNQVFELPDGTKIMIDADTKQASTDVSKFQGDTDGVIEHLNKQQVTVRLSVDDTEVRRYRPPTITIPGQLVPNGRLAQY